MKRKVHTTRRGKGEKTDFGSKEGQELGRKKEPPDPTRVFGGGERGGRSRPGMVKKAGGGGGFPQPNGQTEGGRWKKQQGEDQKRIRSRKGGPAEKRKRKILIPYIEYIREWHRRINSEHSRKRK